MSGNSTPKTIKIVATSGGGVRSVGGGGRVMLVEATTPVQYAQGGGPPRLGSYSAGRVVTPLGQGTDSDWDGEGDS